VKTVLIRAAIPGDLVYIRALERQADTAAHWAEREYDALFAEDAPARVALIAVEEKAGDGIEGFVIARCAVDEWEIENVVVAEGKRRSGLGSRLVRELLQLARTRGATSVLLEVRESNVGARRLYEKNGFSQTGRRRNYYRAPAEDALLLRSSLRICDKIP